MSEHSSKPHEFVPFEYSSDICVFNYQLSASHGAICGESSNHPIHAQAEPEVIYDGLPAFPGVLRVTAEPKPVEIPERERIRQEVWRRSDPRSPDSASHLDQLFEAKIELSRAQQRIASLEAELEAMRK